MAKLDALLGEVAELKTVAASAEALLKGLSDALKAAGSDQAAIDAIVADLDAQTQELANAVSENTPADADPAPPPVETV